LIQLLKHTVIDFRKWDACVAKASNSLVYASSTYLNAICNQSWDAIVIGDYEAVMPLPKRTKFGISYLYQPAFFPCGGIFSQAEIQASTIDELWKIISQNYKYATFDINKEALAKNQADIDFLPRKNYYLELTSGYENIAKQFSSRCKRSIVNAQKFELSYHTKVDYEIAIDTYNNIYGERFKSVTKTDYNNLKLFCKNLDNCIVRAAKNKEGENLAIVLLLKDAKRLYNIIPVVTSKGRKCNANHFLFSELIKEFCNSNFILDFEGSDIKGIAEFYQGFGAREETYFTATYNLLPKIIRILKK
jgi:hypothetical protein